jgi:hypothetical protein
MTADMVRERLTAAQMRDLRQAARHPDGVFRIDGPRGLRYASKERSAAKLVAMGLLTPSPHGDWYITPAGRAALSNSTGEAE